MAIRRPIVGDRSPATMTEVAPRPPIEDRLAAAGLPSLPRTAWLEIDLDALRGNLAVLRGLAGAGIPVRPVVKADAYGHGAVPVSRALEDAGADGFCVATFDEAVELREGGIRGPILVLYPVPIGWTPEAARLGIALTVGDPAGVADSIRAAAGLDPARPLSLELEIETGLGRGGFLQTDELVQAARSIATRPGVVLAGLWTHLQAPADPVLTTEQRARFEAATAAIVAAGIGLPPRHVAASAGLMGEVVVAYDGVRPGLAVYGLVPDELSDAVAPGLATALRPAMRLVARPVRVVDLPGGWGISYGPSFRTTRPSRIATLPVGYGDGWSRSLSNRAAAIVRGRRVPLVGTVAMDAVMADVTDVPGAPVDEHDEFVLLGAAGDERITAAELARERTTISWEAVTAMSRRLPRVYHAAAGPVGLRTLTERRG
jgi:alanine racemase